jgi:hypothetical protein
MANVVARINAPPSYHFVIAVWRLKAAQFDQVKFWEVIADNLSKAGWNSGCVATVDREGRTIFVADAHRGDGRRLVVHPDEKLTAFLGLQSSLRQEAPIYDE